MKKTARLTGLLSHLGGIFSKKTPVFGGLLKMPPVLVEGKFSGVAAVSCSVWGAHSPVGELGVESH